MLISRSVLVFAVVYSIVLNHEVDGWRRRRRRRPRCYPRNCLMTNWSGWSRCTATCGSSGTKTRYRSIARYARCGGSCSYNTRETARCPGTCCPVSCSYSWTSWSSCSATCRYGTRSRRTRVYRWASCGGGSCPSSPQVERCGDGRCCPVNCKVGSWGSWGSCNAACERSGQRTRTRPITLRPTCGGTSCPSTTDAKVCSGPCCPRNCILSYWSAWTKCSSGSCATYSGIQSRTRRVTTAASCGGSCSSLKQSQRCTPTPITCVVSSWGGWQSCIPSNGRCGRGIQKRVRRVIRQNYCSPRCPATQESRSCVHSCCPVNCLVNNWQSWTRCSTTCGHGKITRQRTVARVPSCGGRACPSLSETGSCQQYNDAHCVMGNWGPWSVCDNGCGQGRARKTRQIIRKETCRGNKCGTTEAFKVCTDYRNNRNCKVGQWTSWGKCDQTCTVGTKTRTRNVLVTQRCRGNACPLLKDSTQCGSPNNGCQHKCTNGVCSCNPGYNLVRSKQCVAKDCGKLVLSYCAPGTHKGTTCLHATVSCPNGKTTFPVTCSTVCPRTYAVKGVSTISCTTAGTWSSTAGTYCRRINDPPTQILLSGSQSVAENSPRNTLVGVLSSVDPNSRDSHSYSLITGGEGKFVIRGDRLYTSDVLDYETMKKRYYLTIRSTDDGNPPFYLDKVITISLIDVNEKPTGIQLSNYRVEENSGTDAVVGRLSTVDQDIGQSYTYTMNNAAFGRFKIDGNVVKVAMSNQKCLLNGGDFCALNYEKERHFTIIVRSSDSGTPSLSVTVPLNITLTDVNDQPRRLNLSNNVVMENATKGHVVGRFYAEDEDEGHVLKFSLIESDQGRFGVYSNGTLYKTKDNSTDYETKKVHFIMAKVEDNGIPSKMMNRTFVIEVLDVNEPPIGIHLTDVGGQQNFSRDYAHIEENSDHGTAVGTLEVTDNDAFQSLTIILDDNPFGLFSLSGTSCPPGNQTVCTTQLLVSGDIDFESSNILDITVRVTDQHGLFKVRKLIISVIDVNERPTNVTISGSLETRVLENSAGAFVGELETTDEDSGQSHSCKLLDNSNVFEIRGNKLFLKNKTKLDFEMKDKYVIRITSKDNGTPPLTSEPQTLVIQVLDTNEAPTRITLSNSAVAENEPTGTIIGNLTVDDPDNSGKYSSRQNHVCRLSNSAQGKFRIVIENGYNYLAQAGTSLNYEKAVSHNISIVCSDPKGLSLGTSFVVRVVDVNEAPRRVILSANQISENLAPSIVGSLSTQDPDNLRNKNKQSFQYSISNVSVGFSPFVVDGDVLKTTRSLNYETARQWTVVVRAQDNGSPPMYRDETIVVEVVDENDRPTAVQLSNAQVKENSALGTIVGELATSDEDIGQNHTYQITDSASGRFKVDGNLVLVALPNNRCLLYGGTWCALNYENQASHNITIQTTDSGNPRGTFIQTFEVFLVDVNDQPRDLRLSNKQVKENTSAGAVIGSFSADDEDKRQTLSFSLPNDDGGRFAVNSRGELITAKAVDFETSRSHVIRAQVVDNGYDAKKFERNFTIEILNVNEAPISLSFIGIHAPKVFENATTGTVVGILLARDADANQYLQFRLDDDAEGDFSLNSSTSQCQSVTNGNIKTSCTMPLNLAKSLNYEVTKLRYITVRATDNHGLFTIQRFLINVTDCNDAPTNLTLSGGVSAVVDENAIGEFVGELQTTDEDGSQSWWYDLLDDSGGLFRIIGSKLYVHESRGLDYEQQAVHVISIRSTDSGSPPYQIIRNFTIFVSDLNERPTNITLSKNVIKENSSPGTVIANVTVKDPDNIGVVRQDHTCTVVGQNSNKFTISSRMLVNTVELDHEKTPMVNTTIECADNGSPSLKYREDFTVVVVDMNESPVDIILSNLNIQENLAPGIFATLSTIDPDNSVEVRQNFVYQLIPGQSGKFPFVIHGDNLNTTRKLDHEKKSSWNFTIQSTDNGTPSLTVERSFVVNVQDVNEAPTNIILSPSKVDENSPEDTLVGTLMTVDEDEGQDHRYTLLDGASGNFKLVNNSEIRIATPNTGCLLHGGKYCRLNYEAQSEYTIRVRSTDDGSPVQDFVMDLTISLLDVNDKPRNVSLSNYYIKENVTVYTTIGNFSASDEDKQDLSYSLTENDHGLFDVTKNGRLYVAKSLDHEKSSAVVITVNVTDSGTPLQWMEKQFTIVIQNVNEAPVNTSLKSSGGQQTFADDRPTVNENSPVGTMVGTLVSLDHDAVQTLNFTLDDSAGGRFSVSSSPTCRNVSNISGVKTRCSAYLYVNGALDYESMPRHSIIVRATDDHGLFHVREFTVTVLDQNDRPANVTLQGSFTGQVKENRNDEMIGELVTSDEDTSQSHSYTLKNSSNSRFILKGNRLFTTLTADLDYEQQQEFEIVVASTDDGKPRKTVVQRLTIQVQDVNESPTDITLSRLMVFENSPEGSLVANMTVSDPDNQGPKGSWQTHVCQLLDSAQERFKISNVTNKLLVSTGELNYERDDLHNIVIECMDSAPRPLVVRKSFQIYVLDINETPVQITLSNNEIQENSGPLYVGELASVDPDNEQTQRQTFTYSLVLERKESTFYIQGNHLRTNRSLDYENQSSWELLIKTTDSGGLTLTQNFTINVKDTNDPPTDIYTNQPLIVPENSYLGTPVVVFSAVDEDAGQTHRFYISDVSAYGYGRHSYGSHLSSYFSLDPSSGRLLVTSSIDFETFTQFTIVIMTQDNGYPSFSFNKTFVIDVQDINEPPDGINLDNAKIPENSAQGSVVGNLSVSDPDNINGMRHEYQCKVVNDVPFQVVELKLVLARPVLNFENTTYYLVKINCSQKGNASFRISKNFGINVTDVNEAPFNLNITNTMVKENQPNGALVGTLTADDPDNDPIIFDFSETTADSKKFFISETSLLTSVVFDYERKTSYEITLVAKDDGKPSLSTTRQFIIKILDLNDKPEKIIFYSSGVYENATKGTVVGNFSTIDQDQGQTHDYQLLSYNDTFMINGYQLVVKTAGIMDFESQPFINITVRTTDNGSPQSKTREELIEVRVLDANEPPYDILPLGKTRHLSVQENTKGNTGIVFNVSDHDVNQSHVCTLLKGMDYFHIYNTMDYSVLRVRNGAVLDYERNTSIEISLICSDDGSPSYSFNKTFMIYVTDVNEAPTNVWLNGSVHLLENVDSGYGLGILVCDDPDENQTHSFQVLGKFNDTFNVTDIGNVLQVVSNKKLDYENLDSPSISIELKATDDGIPPRSLVKNISLTIVEVNEGASEIGLRPPNVTINETRLPGTNISELICNNPEKWETLEYTLLSNQDVFMIKTINYTVIYRPSILNKAGIKQSAFRLKRSYLFLRSNLSYDQTPEYELLVGVTDNGKPQLSFNDTVNVRVAKVNPCLPENDCHANANCSRIDGFRYKCLCDDGFTGDGYNCTEIDDCVDSSSYCYNGSNEKECPPCKNNGTCHDLHLRFNCSCLPGFSDSQCMTNIDECNLTLPHHCHNGTCNDAINNFTCSCYRGYTSWLCDKNINDCGSNPCGEHGECVDHVGSYSCNCNERVTGTRCNRDLESCIQNPCLPNQICIPYSLDTISQEGTAKEGKEITSQDVCFSGENITTIYLSKNLTETLMKANSSLEFVSSSLRIALEEWFLKNIQIILLYLRKQESYSESYFYNLTDVSVLDDIKENKDNISVSLVARVGDEALSPQGLVCSLSYFLLNNSTNKTRQCPYPDNYEFVSFKSWDFSYADYLCPTVENQRQFECYDPTQAPLKSTKKPLDRAVYYAVGAVGAVLFIVVIVFAIRGNQSHKFNLQKAMRNREQYDHVRLPEEDDEHYRDVMFRHHISSTISQPGAVNPIYGLEEDEEPHMIQNPLYQSNREDSPPTDHRAFVNPLYDTVERE